jgi:D-alanyl-D-alanine dipeptidase
MSKALPEGFVYLEDVDPTIKKSLLYFTNNNFVGCPIDGYEEHKVITTKEVALRLKEAQKTFNRDGYCIVIYDTYRPQMAVDHFVRWSQDEHDQKMKSWFYPRIDKSKSFELGYLSKRSTHTRGSAVDLTLIEIGKDLHEIVPEPRKLLDGGEIIFLNDGTIDMGSSFDLFDEASHFINHCVSPEAKQKREYLQKIMVEHGFNPYAKEWWHFSLNNEPFPDTYFNFPIK